jgi:hypothetical protein
VQWTLSSQLESDFAFEHEREAFYQPHDVLQLPNGNVLVVDDGTNRPGCTDRVTAECFSRIVMYEMSPGKSHALSADASADDARRRAATVASADDAQGNATAGGGVDDDTAANWEDSATLNRTAKMVWQFEFPLQLNMADYDVVMATDVYNACGGSVYRLADENYLIAFTALDTAASAHNSSKVRTTYAWEVDFHSGNPVVRSSLLLPIPHEDAGTQNAYRITPWNSVYGESTDTPL